jgi:hypothetical protein
MQLAIGNRRKDGRIGPLTPLARTTAEALAATAMTMNMNRGRWRRGAVVAGAALAALSRRRIPGAAFLTLVGVAAYRRMQRRATVGGPVEGAVTIGRSVEEVKARWSDARLFEASGLPLAAAEDPGVTADVRPAPGGRGTELTVRVDDATRLDHGSSAAARLLLLRGLRTFKSLVETGEAPTITGQPAARADRQ